MDDYLLRPADLPTWRRRLALRLLNLIGWKLRFRPMPGPHGICVVYPHTSNVDFFVGLLAKWAMDLPFRWLAKSSLFVGPLGVVMRYWGGVPVERSAPQGATTRLAQEMLASDWCWFVITPEGTRGYRPHWKSGFYRLALSAQVPIVLAYIDYATNEVGVVDHLMLSGDEDADMQHIADIYAHRVGRHPQLAAPVRLAPRERQEEQRRQA